MQRVRVLTTTSTEPVSLALLKAALKVSYDADDTYLSTLPKAARETVEKMTRTCVVRKTLELSLDLEDFGGAQQGGRSLDWEGVREGPISLFSAGEISIPHPPLISIESLTTYDINNVSAVYNASNYRADTSTPLQKGRLCFNFSAVLPPVMRTKNCAVIAFTAGYADGSVPSDLVNAILTTAAWAAKHRVPCDENACKNCGAAATLSQYTILEAGIR